MEDISFKTSRGNTFKSMMSRPQTAKLIKEAMASPLGSTSRAKVQKIFSIMNKLNSNDGAGGPGMMYEQMNYGQMPMQDTGSPSPTEFAKGMVIFHKIPAPKINYGSMSAKNKARAGPPDGSGGPGTHDGEGGVVDWLGGALNTFGNAIGGFFNQNPSPASSVSPSPYGPISSTLSPSFFQTGSAPTQSTLNSLGSNFSLAPVSPPKPISSFLSGITGPTAAASTLNVNYPSLSSLGGLPRATTPPASPALGSNISISPTGNAPRWNATTGTFDFGTQSTALTPTRPTSSASPYHIPTFPTGAPQTGSAPKTSAQTNDSYGYSPSPTPTYQAGSDPVTAAMNAIVGIESGGNYSAVSKRLPSGLRSYGKYQVLETHIPDWTLAATGTAMTKDQFLASSSAQDAVARMQIGQLWGQYGNIADVASVWFTGVPAAQSAEKTDPTTGMTAEQYIARATAAFNGASGSSQTGGGADSMFTSPRTYSGLSAAAKAASDNSTGAGMFAYTQSLDPNGPFGGKTLGQQNASIWDKYNIGGLQDQMNQLQYEGATLPRDVTAYITARDQYLVQTDKKIDDFVKQVMTNTDVSDPSFQKASAQLNYLYTLRGRQNQSYIGFLNDAVTQHQAELDHITNLYGTALNAYERDVTNNTADFNSYRQALSDMYTAVDGAPEKLLTLDAMRGQIINAHTKAISDAASSGAQTDLITQGNKLKGYVWDGQYAIPGLDLVKTIQTMSSQAPEIDPANIIAIYEQGVVNYLSGYVDPSPTASDSVTAVKKKQMAEDAITQFAHFTIAGAANPNTVVLGQQYANDIASRLSALVGNSLTNQAPQLMQAVKTLNPTGGFSSKTPPTEAQFTKTVSTSTGGDALAISMAGAIYAVFQRYVQDGGSAASAVNTLLYPTSSTSDRTNPVPLTADQFAQNLGTLYASNFVQQAFATE